MFESKQDQNHTEFTDRKKQKTFRFSSRNHVRLKSIELTIVTKVCRARRTYVELALKSLSITKYSSKHKEANIEWLENELHQAEYIIDQVWECIKVEISSFYFFEYFVSKKISKSQNSAYETSYDD
ncbi:unnamed protein product [Rhizophagus irregularis]|nr:unnamed protein product [Rhizophagus irregularis]